MPKRKQDYTSLAIQRQAILERLKSGQVRDYVKELKKLEALIRVTILGLDENIGELSRTKLNKLLSQLQADQGAVFKAATTNYLGQAGNVAAVYSAQEVIDLKNTVDVRGTKLNDFTKTEVFAKVIQRPLTTSGQLLEPWIKDFTRTEVSRVNNTIRNGWAQGKTNQQLVQEIIGTKSKRYKDGVLETTRRNASTIVRTSTQHAASAARQDIWEANQDVIAKYEFLATLDSVTSKICRSLDGQTFEFGKGPIPPIHPNCRSTTIPVLDDEFKFLTKGRTRSAEDGPTSAKDSYYDWLKTQDTATQSQVLGPTRAKLFQDGGMSAERFRKLQFDKNFEPLTLKEMQRLEPAAFKKAGIMQPTKKKKAPAKKAPAKKAPVKKAPELSPLDSIGKKFNTSTSSLRRNKISDEALVEIEDGLSVFENNYTRIKVHTRKDRRVGGAVGAHIETRRAGVTIAEDITFRKDLLKEPEFMKVTHARNLEERKLRIKSLEGNAKRFSDDPVALKRINKMLKEQKTIKRFGVAVDSSNPIKSVAAHEAGHAISKSNRLRIFFEAELEKNGVSKFDKLSLSEYAATDNSELFSEVTAAVYTGRKDIVPNKILKAFRKTLKNFPEIKTKGLD